MIAFLLTILVSANCARCETSHNWRDGVGVLSVALNRAEGQGRPLLAVLTDPHQFAWVCPSKPRTPHPRHLLMGLQAATSRLPRPKELAQAVHYTSPRYDPAGMCARWRSEVVHQIPGGHTYCRQRSARFQVSASRVGGR